MKTATAHCGEMGPSRNALRSVRTRLLVWSALLLMSGAGTAVAAILADFNNPATWADGWTFANWGYPKQQSTVNPYEGYGSLQTAFAPTEWNEVTLNFSAQNWSNFTQLSVASRTEDTGTTGSFIIRLLGSSGTILETGNLNITDSWNTISVNLGTVNRTSVTGVKLFWHGTWASSPYRPFNFDLLQVVPEPFSLSLLAMGSIFLLGRRKTA